MTQIYTASVPGPEVKKIFDKMAAIFQGEDENACVIACLSMVLAIQNPEITEKQLMEGVMELSKTVMMVATGVESIDSIELDPSKVY
jgi:hypothetical protein